MTAARNDGGPAFPERRSSGMWVMDERGQASPILETVGGMSLRDYFAGQALAMIGGMGDFSAYAGGTGRQLARDAATVVYGVADAMLAERDKDPT